MAHMSVLSQQAMVFRVQASMEAYMILNNVHINEKMQSYELTIGAEVRFTLTFGVLLYIYIYLTITM